MRTCSNTPEGVLPESVQRLAAALVTIIEMSCLAGCYAFVHLDREVPKITHYRRLIWELEDK